MGLPNPTASETQRVRLALERCCCPLICSHVRLDGDAVGSELGLLHILRALGKSPCVVNEDVVPHTFRFLPSCDEIACGADEVGPGHDLVVVVDAPHFGRLGALPRKFPPGVTRLNIDHHASNERYLDINWVDARYSSAGEMLLELAETANWPIPPSAATCLYVALITDTNRFTLPHTTSESLNAAARLVQRGARHVEVAEKLYYGESFGLMKLKGLTLATLRLALDGRVATARVTLDMFCATGTNALDTHEFAELPRMVGGAVIGVLLREMSGGKVKVSLRCRKGYEVESVARKFGGGGHPEAAGCVVDGTLDEVEGKVLAELARTLKATGTHADG